MARILLAALIAAFSVVALHADPVSLVAGDPLACFNRMEGAGTMTPVSVSGQPFSTAIRIKTGAVADNANPWDIRPRCFSTLPAQQNDVIAVTFWMRTIQAQAGKGFTTFVVERGNSPYTKSITYTAAAGSDWTKVEAPFTMAESYAANAYNLSFWVTFPNQEIEIGGFQILDYGPGVPFSALGLTTWPYAERAADAPWRTAAAQRIERYRKGDIAVVVNDNNGMPVTGAEVHVRMKRHAFGFGTAVAGDALQRTSSDGQNYRDALKKLFNKVVTENVLKWPFFETWARPQADTMLPWFAANGFSMVRGHNVIWPGLGNLPPDVQSMLKAQPVDQAALRSRIADHFSQVMSYTRGKVSEWDVLNEPYTNTDVQKALGDAEMAAWFKMARAADPSVKLYINDYSILESGGYDLAHINAYYRIIQNILANGGPIDGIGLQSHFDSNLTPPSRVLELLDKFAALGKDLQVTEFDVNVADEGIQADYTRDFLTACFSHPAMKGFMIWGFWEGAHWLPRGAMIRKDWSTKPNYDVWNNLIYNQWWTDAAGVTGSDGIFRTRGFLGDYDVEIKANGTTRVLPLTLNSNAKPAYAISGKTAAGKISPNGIVNAASFKPGPVAPGEAVVIYGTGFGSATLALAQYDPDNRLATSVGDTRVLFDGVPAPMVYSLNGQISAIVPYAVGLVTQVQVEYLGVATDPVSVNVASAAPGIFVCGNKPNRAVVINQSAGGSISCSDDFVAPRAGSIVTIFVTGEGKVAPPIEDGLLPAPPLFPAPIQPWRLLFGEVASKPCSADFIGLIYSGVTQVNACVPDGVLRTAALPLTLQIGAANSAPGVTLNTQAP
jgi:endo-1,4-beta-xylanase